MNKRKYAGSAVLVLALFAAGASFAAEEATTTPQGTSYGKEVRAKIANMSTEERKAFFAEKKANWDSMTPEQREALRDAIRSPIAGMSKEEREAFRAEMKEKMDKMTPAEREAARAEHMEHRAERMEHRAERHEAMERPAKVERPGK
jgi:CHASE3 domain sensor protein